MTARNLLRLQFDGLMRFMIYAIFIHHKKFLSESVSDPHLIIAYYMLLHSHLLNEKCKGV